MDNVLVPLIVNTDEEVRVIDAADLMIREQIVSNAPSAI
jgi:hypothetical protein